MTQLDDLPDDCLIEVLERLSPGQLFKMMRANKRWNRLAAIKMEVNPVVAIKLFESDINFSTCSHLNAISPNQTLVLSNAFIKCLRERRSDPSKKTILFSALSRFPSVKCIDFRFFKLPTDLISVIRWCPQLECLKVGESDAKKEEWERVLNRIGHKLVHFVSELHWSKFRYDLLSDSWILKTIAEKCPNIKRVDCKTNKSVNEDFIAAIKMLPKSCWVNFHFDFSSYDLLEDVDELRFSYLNISQLPKRINRVSNLTINGITNGIPRIEGPIPSIEFAGLKKLDFNSHIEGSFTDLTACQFPGLEQLRFRTYNNGDNEHHYEKLFQRMESLKKLTIMSLLSTAGLPRSSISRLAKLETIAFEIHEVSKNSNQSEFIKLLERYVDEVDSLKVLVVEILRNKNKLKKLFKEGIKRLRQSRVAIEFFCRKNYI